MLHIVQCINATRCYSLSQREKKSDSEERMMENHMLEKKSLACRRFFSLRNSMNYFIDGNEMEWTVFWVFCAKNSFWIFFWEIAVGADSSGFKRIQGSSREFKENQKRSMEDENGFKRVRNWVHPHRKSKMMKLFGFEVLNWRKSDFSFE